MKRASLALALLATAFLSRAWGQEGDFPDPCDRSDIAGERICAAQKIETAEKQLAKAFAFALAMQREKIAESNGRMRQWQQQLLDAMLKEQETWKEYRDAKCAREGAEDLGLSIGRVFELECVANETQRRVQELPRAPDLNEAGPN